MRVVNPSGKVPAWSSTYLECHFYPLEAKTYAFPLTIKYSVDAMMASSSSSSLLRQQSGLSTASSTGALLKRTSLLTGTPSATGGPQTFQYLNLTVQVEGYDPRRPKPVPKESHRPGGVAPAMPLLQMPSQKVTLSHDLLDFSVIPQHCTARCITVLRNTSTTTTCDFCVEEMSCDLFLDGLLSAKPMAGRIGPQQCAVIEFSFRALCQSMCLLDRCKIIIRDIIKGSSKKQSAMKEALMKKINKRVRNSTIHCHMDTVNYYSLANTSYISVDWIDCKYTPRERGVPSHDHPAVSSAGAQRLAGRGDAGHFALHCEREGSRGGLSHLPL